MSETTTRTPATFKDAKGRTWAIRLNPILVKQCQQLTGIHLTKLDSDPFLALERDPLLLCDVLWCLCEADAKQAGVGPEDFYQSLEGEQIAAAAEAIEDAICFFSHPATRLHVRGSLSQSRSLRSRAVKKAMERLTDPGTEDRILAAMSAEAERQIARALEFSGSGDSIGEKSAT